MNTQKLFTSLCLLLATSAGQELYAQHKVAAPMEDVNHVVDNTLDSLNLARTVRPVPGSSRRGDNPVLFLIGNSTMRTGTLGNGNNGQWGWGYFEHEYFDENKITVENHALGGTSSRTFYRKLWPDVKKGIRKGDYVIIELGHNDNGPFDSGRARASIRGISPTDSLCVTIKETGEEETVYSYGEYLRRFVRECKALGAHPILLSLTPRNAWDTKRPGHIARVDGTFGLWARQVAEEQGIPFVDLAYLHKRDLQGNVLSYRRRKTGRALTVSLTPEAMQMVRMVANRNPDSPYLFPILQSEEGTEAAYREYQSALRGFNQRLAVLRQCLGMQSALSTYAARHTWATMAYHCEIHPGIISEAMGHSSITVTETYLKPFSNRKIDEANQRVISFVRSGACTV